MPRNYIVKLTELLAILENCVCLLLLKLINLDLKAVSELDYFKCWHGFKIILEIRDSQNLAKLGHGCTTKLIDGGRERIEFRFN